MNLFYNGPQLSILEENEARRLRSDNMVSHYSRCSVEEIWIVCRLLILKKMKLRRGHVVVIISSLVLT